MNKSSHEKQIVGRNSVFLHKEAGTEMAVENQQKLNVASVCSNQADGVPRINFQSPVYH